MADQDQPARRTPSAYQPIEPLDEGETGLPAPPPPPPAPPTVEIPGEPEPPAVTVVPSVPVAVRFASAAAALAFAGQLLSIGRGDNLGFLSGTDQARWVRATVELDIARELTAAARGTLYVGVASGRFAEDYGWGDPPGPDSPAADPARSVDLDSARRSTLAELIRIAGLHAVRERPAGEVRALLPGWLLADVLQRVLDLRLQASHRPVRLHPLFPGGPVPDGGPPERGPANSPDPSSGRDSAALIELRLYVSEGHLPPSLLAALSREPQLTLCRVAGENGNLLMEYGMAAPLLDHLLAGLIQDQTWVLSSRQFGCHLIEPAGDFSDSSACVRLADSHPLQSVLPPSDDRPALPQLQLVRERTYGRNVDAILLSSSDLDAVALLFEGQPLSESAQLVRGRDRHLLVAPGGLVERVPVGEPLYCLGPGPLYLPLGAGIRPRLPVNARRALFAADEKTAVVVLPGAVLQFSLEHRDPVWMLWVGPLPDVEVEVPAGTRAALREVETSASPDRGSGLGIEASSGGGVRAWLDEALDAEFRGELVLAAELHERHGDPMRAARLFARAAEEDPGHTPRHQR